MLYNSVEFFLYSGLSAHEFNVLYLEKNNLPARKNNLFK